ncbi:TIGR04211 family SH3 domain-containing protein [Photorhabdus antumapuensis]|uniref:TIGR04211 family SH3 domain-containing protein n=1 Tax=Photorhabdus antumapuensis TaxID=2862867 RepID=UPI001CED44EA|nr:TIGR04211 family SH3 domain-containing protein [Photorhabdus antumapuensis]MCA6222468.1 SH3 domain-containing protein [Photorhabdus antumapuensis]
MRKLHLLLTALIILSFSLTTHAEGKRYVSDELSTYTHAGPGNQYRIAGTLNAGDEVTLISINRDSNYAQVKDDKGRLVWLPVNQLSNKPSLRTRLPELEQEVKTLTEKLANIDNNWNQRTADMQLKASNSSSIVAELKKENERLKNKLTVAEKKLDVANLQLDDKQRNIILQWFMYGGGVAGAGLIFGLLLPHMIPRRKRNDRWMS